MFLKPVYQVYLQAISRVEPKFAVACCYCILLYCIIHSATKDAVNAWAEVVGAALKEVVQAAVETMTEEVEMSEIFVTVAGMVASFVGTFIITTAAMVLIDLIFSSGGTAPILTDGIYCHVTQLPDGAVIARQINYDGSLLEFETPQEPKREPAVPST